MNTKNMLAIASHRIEALDNIITMYESRVKTLKTNPRGCGTPDYRRAELDTLEMVIGDLSSIEGGEENNF